MPKRSRPEAWLPKAEALLTHVRRLLEDRKKLEKALRKQYGRDVAAARFDQLERLTEALELELYRVGESRDRRQVGVISAALRGAGMWLALSLADAGVEDKLYGALVETETKATEVITSCEVHVHIEGPDEFDDGDEDADRPYDPPPSTPYGAPESRPVSGLPGANEAATSGIFEPAEDRMDPPEHQDAAPAPPTVETTGAVGSNDDAGRLLLEDGGSLVTEDGRPLLLEGSFPASDPAAAESGPTEARLAAQMVEVAVATELPTNDDPDPEPITLDESELDGPDTLR